MVFRVFYMAALLGVALSFRSAAGSAAEARPKIAPVAHASAAGQTYAIVDLGAPPVATYPESSPVGFNNTGQIFGVAQRAAKGNRASYATDTDCLVWTGTRYIDLSPSLTGQGCTPNAMSSAATPGGSVSVVGSFTDIHHGGYAPSRLDAFSALVSAHGTAKLLPYYDHSPAELQGVNVAGTAVGYSYDDARYDGALFVTTPPQQLTSLQPACTSLVSGCLQALDFIYQHRLNGEPPVQCPFGGCTITDAGTVLGFDFATKAYALTSGGSAAASHDIPLPFSTTYVVSINSARQILYFSPSSPGVVSRVYDLAAGTSTSVPPVAGTSCANYYPISLNDAEEVLGYTSRCAGRDFYWTWDPLHGTRSVDAALPASAFTVTPLGVNDNGQILVSLLPKVGPAHWGTLDPPATQQRSKRGSRTSAAPPSSGGAARLMTAANVPVARAFKARAPVPRVFPQARSGIVVRTRSRAATAPSYSIRTIGAPAGYVYSAPYGFNNTGQIFGIADRVDADQGFEQECMLWNGSSFKRLPLPPATLPGTSCTPSGMNDGNAVTGEYEIVGSAREEFAFGTRAFAVVASAAGFKRATVYYAYSPSLMVGVNANQVALATAAFVRDTAYDLQGMPYFTTTAAANSLLQLQPLASADSPTLHYLIPTYASPCPFGGCAINDRNEVLGYDYLTSTIASATAALYTVGNPASLLHLPIQDSLLGPPSFPVAFNSANQLAYFVPALNTAAIYNVDTGVRTVIPVSPPGCAVGGTATPISMNNHGAVLGLDRCPQRDVYWTWDPINGTRYLDAQIPASAYTVFPLGINDSGQILVTLETLSGAITTGWGTLDPVGPGVKRPRSARQ